MKNLITVILIILSLTTFAQTEKLEGKWISESESTDGEIIVYEFENNETLKMYFDGKELPTKKPIEYKIIENKNRTEIEIQYVSPWNNSTEKMYGLIEFLKNGKIKMEFFPFDEQVGKKNEFSKEAVIFKKKNQLPTMAISNCLFLPTSENPLGFSACCVLAKLNTKPRNYS